VVIPAAVAGRPSYFLLWPELGERGDFGDVAKVREPWVKVTIISPSSYLGALSQLLFNHEGITGDTFNIGDGRSSIVAEMPLRELMRNFFDELKSISSGYASVSYEMSEIKDAEVTKMEVMVMDQPVSAFTRVIAKNRIDEEAKATVEKLHKILPRQMVTTKIQAKINGKIVSSKTLQAFKKNVTAHMYGGDITRKKKLWEKEKSITA
jgi:GTP-binding protein LepA